MKYIKKYEDSNIEITYEDIVKAGFYIEEESGLKKGENGYHQWMYRDIREDRKDIISSYSGEYILSKLDSTFKNIPSDTLECVYEFIFKEIEYASYFFLMNFCEKYNIKFNGPHSPASRSTKKFLIIIKVPFYYIKNFSELYDSVKKYNL
jgi:hypothetical protein